MTDRFKVGVVASTHGVAGEVKVYPTTDDALRFKKLKEVTAVTQNGELKLHIERVRFFKQYVIVKFTEYGSLNDVEFLKKAELTIPREAAVELEEDEYYVADLIGLNVKTDDGEDFGTVTDVLRTGANDVYAIDHNGTEVLIPAIKDCILDVDPDEQVMRIHLLEGLI